MEKILIVEDDIKQLNLIRDSLVSTYPSWTIDTAVSYESALDMILTSVSKRSLYTLFLLDVKLTMDETNTDGFILGQKIREIEDYYITPVLYLSSVYDHNFNALHDVHYYDYITKPYTMTDILNSIENMMIKKILKQDVFYITDVDAINHKINPNDITYIHSTSHILEIHLDNYKIVTRNISMSTMLSYVTPWCIKCHNRYIVNKKQIKNFDPINKYIRIGNNSIPVSKAHFSTIKEIFQKG